MIGSYHLQLFGRPALIAPDGQPVRFRTCKHLALLVYLHLEAQERGVSRDLLIDLLWPDADPSHGRHSLSQALSVVRTLLGPSAVSRGSGTIRLVQPVETDMDRIARGIATSTDLTAPLAGLESCAKADFAHWVDAVRARLTRTAAELLREQLSSARNAGNVTAVHEQAGLLYQVDPLSDIAVQALAEQLLLAGDVVGTIRLLRAHSERLRRELNCDPQPELRGLADRLEADPRAEPSTRVVAPEEAPHGPALFIGRDRELARLESLWSRARSGRIVTCSITGMPGVGKSSLVERFTASIVARTWPAISITCQEIGRDIPFAAIADLLYAVGRDPQTSGADPEWLGEASRLAPGLRSRYPGIPKPPTVAPEAVKLRAAEAIAHILGAVSDNGPLLLVLDNVHHMDPVSAEILHLVMRRLEHAPVLVLGTARGDQELTGGSAGAGAGAGAGKWDSIQWRLHEPLMPMTPPQATALVQALTQDQKPVMPRAIQDKVVELSQGIPYLIEMLVSDWVESGDDSLATAELIGGDALHRWQPSEMMKRAFARQLAGLDDAVQEVLSLLSVAERPLQPDEIGELLQISSRDIHRVNLQLLRRGIVRLADRGLMFKNELHRAFVYRETDPDTQRYLHQRMAGRVSPSEGEAVGAGTTELERSHHLRRSGDVDGAVASAIEGARVALERGAFREVERVLQPLAATAPPNARTAVVLLLAQALSAQGHFRSALDAASDIIGAESDDNLVAIRVRAEASLRGRLGSDEQIRTSVIRYVREATRLDRPAELLHAIQLRLEAATDDGDLETIEELRSTAQRLATTSSELLVKARALLAEGYCRLLLNEATEAASSFCEAASLFRALHDTPDFIQCLKGVGVAYAAMAAYEPALAFYREAVSAASQANDTDTFIILLSNMSVAAQDQGEFDSALRSLLQATQTVDERSNPRRAVQICINAASVFACLQRTDVAEALISAARGHAHQARSWRLIFNVIVNEAHLSLAKGNVQDALEGFERAESLRQGRTLFFVGTGVYERLRRYAAWVSDTARVPPGVDQHKRKRTTLFPLVDRLALALMDEWMVYSDTGQWRDSTQETLQRMTQLRLFGVLTDLSSIGVGIPGLAPSNDRSPYTAVRRVAAHYPGQMSVLDEGAVDVLAHEFLGSVRERGNNGEPTPYQFERAL